MDRDTLEAAARVCEDADRESLVAYDERASGVACAALIRALAQQAGQDAVPEQNAAPQEAVDTANSMTKMCDSYADENQRLSDRAESAEAQVAALTEAYAAACIRLQALGEKTVPLTQAAARVGKEGT